MHRTVKMNTRPTPAQIGEAVLFVLRLHGALHEVQSASHELGLDQKVWRSVVTEFICDAGGSCRPRKGSGASRPPAVSFSSSGLDAVNSGSLWPLDGRYC